IYLLQIKNLINKGDNSGATTVLHRLLSIAPHNPEAHNLKGIILANSGDTAGAHNAIIQSQALFIQEDIARNNIAVISMLEKRYKDAVKILLPDYLSGKRNSLILHNLVFALIKIGDTRYAKNIIEAERLSDNADELVLALSQVDSLPQEQSVIREK
ncbi:tetratricopeptide repeat protein, partial [Yersinia similis]